MIFDHDCVSIFVPEFIFFMNIFMNIFSSGFQMIAIHEGFPRLHFEFSLSLLTS